MISNSRSVWMTLGDMAALVARCFRIPIEKARGFVAEAVRDGAIPMVVEESSGILRNVEKLIPLNSDDQIDWKKSHVRPAVQGTLMIRGVNYGSSNESDMLDEKQAIELNSLVSSEYYNKKIMLDRRNFIQQYFPPDAAFHPRDTKKGGRPPTIDSVLLTAIAGAILFKEYSGPGSISKEAVIRQMQEQYVLLAPSAIEEPSRTVCQRILQTVIAATDRMETDRAAQN